MSFHDRAFAALPLLRRLEIARQLGLIQDAADRNASDAECSRRWTTRALNEGRCAQFRALVTLHCEEMDDVDTGAPE